jgi:hypothetical protein
MGRREAGVMPSGRNCGGKQIMRPKDKKAETLPKAKAKRLEVLGMREKYHRFELLMYRGQQALDEQFGVWSPAPPTRER